jgi:hypothetical protein
MRTTHANKEKVHIVVMQLKIIVPHVRHEIIELGLKILVAQLGGVGSHVDAAVIGEVERNVDIDNAKLVFGGPVNVSGHAVQLRRIQKGQWTDKRESGRFDHKHSQSMG